MNDKAAIAKCYVTSTILFLAIAAVGRAAQSDRAPYVEMAARVDQLLAERWNELGIQPAAPADDSELVRRVYLDLTGVIPRVSQARAFLNDQGPNRKGRLIDALLDSPAHATHLANTWRNIMLPGGADPTQTAGVVGLQNWLRNQFVDNVRYDRIVADLLVANGGRAADPALFFTSLGLEPEKLAAGTARTFLGIQLDCAQCHDHPFDDWTQHDFWGYAAFFARVEQSNNNSGSSGIRLIDRPRGEVMLPDTQTVVQPLYPAGTPVDARARGTRRQQLAIWIASRSNPYLARATVNRVWAQLFGRGLVEPVDDLGPHNPPSHPLVLEELSDYFIDTGYNLRNLYRTLANTSTYQLSSATSDDQDRPTELFAQMSVKPMTAEQLYDSLSRVMRRKTQASTNRGDSNPLSDPRRQAFVAKFRSPSRNALEYQAGAAQALSLMNGSDMTEATSVEQSGLLAAAQAPLFSDQERLEILYLAALTRRPRENEQTMLYEYIENSGDSDNRREAFADILWALLNSAEFAMNH